MSLYYQDDDIQLYNGKCEDVLAQLKDDSVDSIVTDPPAGIGFMEEWDSDKGGRDEWVKWMTSVMSSAYRVLKPGGHIFVWAIPRTSHWTSWAIEDAGFVIKDKKYHIFGSGFPKNMWIDKQLDKMAGATREVVGFDKSKYRPNAEKNHSEGQVGKFGLKGEGSALITAPATDEAKQWEGWGTALKPAVEEWILAYKPVSEKNIALNVLKYGTGAINIAASRVDSYQEGEFEKLVKRTEAPRNKINGGKFHAVADVEQAVAETSMSAEGRFPADLVLSHSPNCKFIGTKKVKGHKGYPNGPGGLYSKDYREGNPIAENWNNFSTKEDNVPWKGHADEDGMETVEDWDCAEDCPIRIMNEQSGIKKSGKMKAGTTRKNTAGFNGAMPAITGKETIGDSGGVARYYKNFPAFSEEDYDVIDKLQESVPFFYVSKPSPKEKDAGLTKGRLESGTGQVEKNKNRHPTVKPIKLMSYLVKLITPPNGTVLDMFMGSGTTGVAAIQNGFKFVGVEGKEEYCKLSKDRIIHWSKVGENDR